MRQKTIATFLTLAICALAILALFLNSARHRPPAALSHDSGTTVPTPAASTAVQSQPSEGCRVGTYTGTKPLNQLQYYVAGNEDLRGGMTCTFRINSNLPPFNFHFAGHEDNTFGNLEITEGGSDKIIQTIENTIDPNEIAPAKVQDFFKVVDANFDGYQDLQILLICGAQNCSYDFYIYDPKTNRFVHDNFLSDLKNPVFNQTKKQISQGWLFSVNDGGGETYQYENGQYTLIQREISAWDRTARTVTHSTYERRDGQMQLVESKTEPTD
jgi:hypothetical protein